MTATVQVGSTVTLKSNRGEWTVIALAPDRYTKEPCATLEQRTAKGGRKGLIALVSSLTIVR